MFNLYTYEKNKFIKDNNKLLEEKAKKFKIKRNLELKKLSSNYEKRMNDFILHLCEHPIFIKDYTKKNIELKSRNKTIYKNLSVRGLMTNKNRNNKCNILKKKNITNYGDEKKSNSKKHKDINNLDNKNKEKNLFVQPKMRFKPRNQLERIIEVMELLGSNKRKNKMKKILDQLKQTDFNKLKQSKEYGKLKQIYKNKIKASIDRKKENNNSSNNEDTDEDLDFTLEVNLYRKIRNIGNKTKKKIELINKKLKEDSMGENIDEKNIIRALKTRNKEIFDFFKDDEKTYFKGASQYAMIYNNMRTNKNKKNRLKSAYIFNNSTGDFNNYYFTNNLIRNTKTPKNVQRPVSMNSIDYKINDDNIIKNKLKNSYKDGSFKKLGTQFQDKKRNMDNVIKKEIDKSILNQFYSKLDKKEYSELFNIPFFLEKNTIVKKKAKTIDYDLDNKLKYLRKIISLKNDSENNNIIQQSKTIKNKVPIIEKKIHEIIIDGKKYKYDDIKNISDAIFTKCGYYKKKIVK